MRLLSWNVKGSDKPVRDRQVEAVLERDVQPDIVALQELQRSSFPEWQRRFESAGYGMISTRELLDAPYPDPPYLSPPFPPHLERVKKTIERRYFNLIAARDPIRALPGLSFDDPEEERYAFPEKYLVAAVKIDGVEIHVHNAHLPPGRTRGEIKVHAYEAIRRRVIADEGKPRVLCGDFNAPVKENDDGPLPPRLKVKWPAEVKSQVTSRWITAETELFSIHGMRDVYRADKHVSDTPFPVSYDTGSDSRPAPHRYDYIFASEELTTIDCRYAEDWLEVDDEENQLSDHARVEAEFSLPPP